MKQKTRGQAMTDYLIIIGVISITAIPVVTQYGKTVATKTVQVADAIAGNTDLGATLSVRDRELERGIDVDDVVVPEAENGTSIFQLADLVDYTKSTVTQAVDKFADILITESYRVPIEVLEAAGATQRQIEQTIERYEDLLSPRREQVDNISTTLNAILAGDGFLQADRKVKEQVANGDYEGAFTTIWEQAMAAPIETALATPAVRNALDRLGVAGELIQIELPQTARRVARVAARETWNPIGSAINDALWQAYNSGYVSRRPRLAENYFD